MNTRDSLAASLSIILEDAVFVFAELVEESPTPFDVEFVQAVINYSGDHKGQLILRMSVPFALQIAEELMLEDDGPLLAEEVVGELLNVIAGHWMVKKYGERTLFTLSTPATERLSVEPSINTDNTATLITDEGDRVDLLAA